MSQLCTGIHVSLPPAGPSWAAVFGVAQLSPLSGDQAQGSAQPSSACPNHILPPACAGKHQESFSPPSPELLHRAGGCHSALMACPRCCPGPRSRARRRPGGRTAVSSRCLHQTAWEKRNTPRAPRTPSCSARESPWTRGTARERALGAAGDGDVPSRPGPGCFPCCPKQCPIPGCCVCSGFSAPWGTFIIGIGRQVGAAAYPRSSQPDPEQLH